jgi:hypothetical protein
VVTGVSYGTANIVVTTQDGGLKDSCVVTVQNIPVTGISVPEEDSVRIGGAIPISYSFSPSNASNKNIRWLSGDTTVATVDSTGVVRGIKEGFSNIIVTTEDGNFSDTCVVKVYYSVLPMALFDIGFNENAGSMVSNAGSVVTTLTKTEPPTWSTNVPDNGGTSSLDFGTNAGNYYVETGSVISQLAGLSSFTVTGWVNCRSSVTGAGGNRIVSWINNGGDGVDIVYATGGTLKVGVNEWPDNTIACSSSGMIPTDPDAGASNWRFFVVTYDSSTDSLRIYFGSNNEWACLDKAITYSKGAVGTDIGKLAIGHFNDESNRTGRTDRMFRGLIDGVKIFDSVLNLNQIKLVQNIETATAVEQIINPEFGLNIYPNPFHNSTTLSYRLPATSAVSLKVYDILGNEVTTLANGFRPAGLYKVTFDASKLASLTYIVRLTVTPQNGSKSYTQVKKMIFAK